MTDAGLGQALRACRRGAQEWARLIATSADLTLYQQPELDIVTYFPAHGSMSAVDAASQRLFVDAAQLPPHEQVHLATYTVTPDAMTARRHAVDLDAPSARILRSTVMKPESADAVPAIHGTLERLVRTA